MRNTLLPVLVVLLSAAFVAVSLGTTLSGGRGPLLRTKLRLGAWLLSLTGVATGVGCGAWEPSCYKDTAVPVCVAHAEKDLDGTFYATPGAELRFRLQDCIYADASGTLRDDAGTEVVTSPLTPLDDSEEEFYFLLPKDLAPGTYVLTLFTNAHPDLEHQKLDDVYTVVIR